MRKANRNVSCELVKKRLAETLISENERIRAVNMMRDADAIADAILWAKDKIASLGAFFLKPSFKN